MSGSSLAKKLLIKPDQRLLIINPPLNYPAKLAKLPAGVHLLKSDEGEADQVQLFVHNIAELNALAPQALGAIKYDGILWIIYPKKSSKMKSDLSRDEGWEAVTGNGLTGIAMVSIDDTWSAMRFRPIEKVGK